MSDLTTIQSTGPSSQRVDLVFVSEGYLASERNKFLSDAAAFLDAMLGDSNAALNQPFSTFKNYFNASALFVASRESGVDTATFSVDTYFGAAQHSSDGRLVYGDSALVRSVVGSAYASNAHEITVVLVNSSQYGGAGGSVVWATTGNKSSAEILLHEIGHGFASLEDEYVDSSLLSTYPLSRLDSVHLTSTLSQIPWTSWLGFSDELGTVGTFEGGYYRSTGVWRATLDSKMYHLGVAFNAPEKEAFALAYYAAIGDYLSLDSAIPGLVRAIEPDANVLSFKWDVNGAAIPGVSGAYLDLYGSGMYAASQDIKLTTTDSTGYIRNGLSLTMQTDAVNLTNSAIIDVVTADYVLSQTHCIVRFGSDNNTIFCGSQPLQDYIDGGAGNDTLVFESSFSNYVITNLPTGTQIISLSGTPLLAAKGVEFAKFFDVTIRLSDTTAPTVTAFSPLKEATGVPVSTDFVITFDEPIIRGVGDIILKTASGSTVAVFDASTSSNVSIKGSTLTINPGSDLSFSAGYRLEFASGVVRDTAGNNYAGTTSYNFTTKQGVNFFTGTSANEAFTTGTGNDTVDGGAGIDTVIFTGTKADHSITRTATGWTVSSAVDGTDTIQNVERLLFSNETLALDIAGNAGQAYRIYQAAFNRTPDNGGLKYWIGRMDGGTTQDRVAAEFVGSPEFQNLYGTNPSNADFLTKLYSNVLHRTPDFGGYTWWLGQLDAGVYNKTTALASFAESPENQAGVIGVIQNGIELFV
jgi:hypothetical protein